MRVWAWGCCSCAPMGGIWDQKDRPEFQSETSVISVWWGLQAATTWAPAQLRWLLEQLSWQLVCCAWGSGQGQMQRRGVPMHNELLGCLAAGLARAGACPAPVLLDCHWPCWQLGVGMTA